MTNRTQLELTLDRFLADGPESVSDRALLDALDAVDRTPQRRGLLGLWKVRGISRARPLGADREFPVARRSTMSGNMRLVGAIAVLALTGVGAMVFLGGGPVPIPSQPTPISTPALTPAGTAAVSIFSSERYGYSARYPSAWALYPSERAWKLDVDKGNRVTTAADRFNVLDRAGFLGAFAVTLPAGTDQEAWIAEYFGPDGKGSSEPCTQTRLSNPDRTKVDGLPVVFWQDNEPVTAECGGTFAFVQAGDRLFVFYELTASRSATLLEVLLAGVDLP